MFLASTSMVVLVLVLGDADSKLLSDSESLREKSSFLGVFFGLQILYLLLVSGFNPFLKGSRKKRFV
jgi:hypothetical protein